MRWMNLEPIIQSEVSQKEKGKYHILMHIWASLVAQLIKNPPAMRETSVQSLGWEDALEKGKSTRSSNLAGHRFVNHLTGDMLILVMSTFILVMTYKN